MRYQFCGKTTANDSGRVSFHIWTPLNLVPPEQIFLKYLDPSEKLIFVPTIKASVMKANQFMSAVLKALRLVPLILLATGSLKIMAERNQSVAAKRAYDREQRRTIRT